MYPAVSTTDPHKTHRSRQTLGRNANSDETHIAGQLKAIEHGRAAGVPWHHFAEALCVTSKQGAYQKAQRLKAEQVREPGERRAPEVAREHADRADAEERAERAMILVQEWRFPVARHITRLLLEHRDGLVLDSWAAYWLGELADTIDDRDDPAERARFTGWLESFVRAIHGHARERNQPCRSVSSRRPETQLNPPATIVPVMALPAPMRVPHTSDIDVLKHRGGRRRARARDGAGVVGLPEDDLARVREGYI
ncbi:hypothetical protein OG981_51585 [Streptomyces mirabilis]|uniref:hypothetical protein n=1 Tax=Streptomyces mirabilis TaxID=68239 RepID=UPI002E2082A3